MQVTVAILAAALAAASGGAVAAEPALQLRQALPIEGATQLEPSGLELCDGQLLMVSDNHGDRIFSLRPEGAVARAEVFLEFDPGVPRGGFKERLTKGARGPDFEGIACSGGRYWLASESLDAVLEIDPPHQQWRHSELREVAREAGLFAHLNAHLEGITYHAGELWLVAEREPRGWLRVAADGTISAGQAADGQQWTEKLAADYTGMASVNGQLLVLERNAWRVCLMELPVFKAKRCADFGKALVEAGIGYDTGKSFGIAEGLAADADNLWIVLDHGKAARTGDPDDQRPLLLQFDNPF